jgi:hypothetical protein
MAFAAARRVPSPGDSATPPSERPAGRGTARNEVVQVGVDGDDASLVSASCGNDVGVWRAEQVQVADMDGVVAGADQERGDARRGIRR